MANNRELSQLGSFIVVDDTTKNIGIATTAIPYVGIGTINPQAKLHVVGDTIITGIISATSFIGDGSNLINIQSSAIIGVTTFSSTSGISTNVIGGIASITQLNVSEVSTFTNGPILVGTATSTGILDQRLQVTGGAYVSGSVGIGTTNPTSALHVVGDVLVTGVVTATSFSGTATSTTNIPNLTGAITSNNTTTSLGSFSSSNLSTALSDKTGSGSVVFATSPVLVTPSLGIATATNINVSGSVGIGTTNPGATLNVVPTETSIAGLFSGTTSSDMVRITQLGTGNALVVEDSANPDSSPFVVNASGSVGIGTTNPQAKLHVVGDTNIVGIVSASAFFGSGYNLTDIINTINISKIEGIEIRDEGSLVGSGGTFTSLNFVGSGVVATGIGSTAIITINNSGGGGGGGEIFIQNEGTQVGGAVTTINIVGPKITAVNSGVGIATISVDIDYFPIEDYGDLDSVTTDFFGIPLSYSFDCLTQPQYMLSYVDLTSLV